MRRARRSGRGGTTRCASSISPCRRWRPWTARWPASLSARRPRSRPECRASRPWRRRPPVMRIHADLHLGQILVADDGYLVIDFEGEPTAPDRGPASAGLAAARRGVAPPLARSRPPQRAAPGRGAGRSRSSGRVSTSTPGSSGRGSASWPPTSRVCARPARRSPSISTSSTRSRWRRSVTNSCTPPRCCHHGRGRPATGCAGCWAMGRDPVLDRRTDARRRPDRMTSSPGPDELAVAIDLHRRGIAAAARGPARPTALGADRHGLVRVRRPRRRGRAPVRRATTRSQRSHPRRAPRRRAPTRSRSSSPTPGGRPRRWPRPPGTITGRA